MSTTTPSPSAPASSSPPSPEAELEQLNRRNRDFAATYQGGLQMRPRFLTGVLTCADPRIDPAHFLGLELGDAVVMRNLGGRVDAGIEREMSILSAMTKMLLGPDAPPLHLAIVHHTDCGMERFASVEAQARLGRATGIDAHTIDELAIADHDHSFAADVDRLRRSPVVPNRTLVSCHLYDVHSGTLTQVRAPAPLA